MCTEKNKVYANIVLAGDPKQLDAITKSDFAAKLGYKTSWLEHLCNLNLYKRDASTGKFNQTFITQLVKNYRSHPAILKIPNELFYGNALKPKAATGEYTACREVCIFRGSKVGLNRDTTTIFVLKRLLAQSLVFDSNRAHFSSFRRITT